MSKRQNIREGYDEAPAQNWSSLVKGLIAIMITALLVVMITLLFAKSLFVSNATSTRETGRLTAPPNYTTISTTTTSMTTTTTTTTTTKAFNDDPYKQEEPEQTGQTQMIVKSAVWLHPQPNSSSENILVIPKDAQVTAFSITNGNWIEVEYNGHRGYAYGDFFTGDRPTNIT